MAAGAWAAWPGVCQGITASDLTLCWRKSAAKRREKVFTYRKYVSDQILLEEACGMGEPGAGRIHVPSTHDEEKGDLK